MPVRPSPWASALKAIHRARIRGVAEVAALAGQRLAEAVWSDDELVVLSRIPGGPQEEGEWELRRAELEDAAAYARDIGTDTEGTFRQRVSGRTACWVVRDGPRLVHATWVTTGEAWTRELRAYVAPPQGDAYIYESYTRPGVRGRGVYPFALRGIAAALETHVRSVWVMVEADNPASLRAVSKAGFEPRGSFSIKRRFDRLTFSSGGEVGLRTRGRGPRSGAAQQTNP